MKIGLCSSLTVAFVVLKLLGKISWSWWWVLAPTWIPFAVVLSITALALGAVIITGGIKSR